MGAGELDKAAVVEVSGDVHWGCGGELGRGGGSVSCVVVVDGFIDDTSSFDGTSSSVDDTSSVFDNSSLAERSLAERSLAERSLAERSLVERSLAERSLVETSLAETSFIMETFCVSEVFIISFRSFRILFCFVFVCLHVVVEEDVKNLDVMLFVMGI